jgi:cell division septum initiation protein DivIVA
MNAELHADDRTERPSELASAPGFAPRARRRPNVSGDLPTLFDCAPMFRRAVGGYDRYQVDTYVQWAEDELATADREREHLLGRHLATRAALQEAQALLSHSSSGAEFLGVSRRIGSMLAAAADEAESLRSEAEADRSAANAETQRLAADADRLLTDAGTEARRVVDAALAEAERVVTEAAVQTSRMVEEAELAGREARAEAEARLAKVRLIEQRAAEHAEQLRMHAVTDAAAALLAARAEVVRMLGTGREERRRADAEAAAMRERVDREAAARSAFLLAEVEALEHRRSQLQAEVELLAVPLAPRSPRSLEASLHRLAEHLRWRSPRALSQ